MICKNKKKVLKARKKMAEAIIRALEGRDEDIQLAQDTAKDRIQYLTDPDAVKKSKAGRRVLRRSGSQEKYISQSDALNAAGHKARDAGSLEEKPPKRKDPNLMRKMLKKRP